MKQQVVVASSTCHFDEIGAKSPLNMLVFALEIMISLLCTYNGKIDETNNICRQRSYSLKLIHVVIISSLGQVRNSFILLYA